MMKIMQKCRFIKLVLTCSVYGNQGIKDQSQITRNNVSDTPEFATINTTLICLNTMLCDVVLFFVTRNKCIICQLFKSQFEYFTLTLNTLSNSHTLSNRITLIEVKFCCITSISYQHEKSEIKMSQPSSSLSTAKLYIY